MNYIIKDTRTALYEYMTEYNRAHGITQQFDPEALSVYVVYSTKNWPDMDFEERERTYKVSSANKGFLDGMLGNSIYGDCLDGLDMGVRLDWYNWEIESVYTE